MDTRENWLVELTAEEKDGQTRARARLRLTGYETWWGTGSARLNPADSDVTLIGEEIAIARALSDLAGKLLHAAEHGIEDITHTPAHLHG